MLGFTTIGSAAAVWLSLGAAALCVVYGLLKWNDRGAPDRIVAGKPASETRRIR